jgi:protein SCO1/2
MKQNALPCTFALFAALFLLAFVAHAGNMPGLKTGAFDPPRAAPDFLLNGSNGSELKLSRYRGKVVALGFGYTSCPEVCPTTMAFLAEARKKLGAARDDFQVVYVTVDPERDTADKLRKFVTAFDPTFVGATGTPAQLAAVRNAYGIQVSRLNPASSDDGYLLHHSSFIYLIDRSGNLRAMMPFGVSVDDIAHDVKVLLTK